MTTTSPDAAPARRDSPKSQLAIPDGWLIDALSGANLREHLERADKSVAGVVAERIDLEPGSSARVAAERAALISRSDGRRHDGAPADGAQVDGAVLLRAGTPFEVRDASILVGSGPLLIDPRAVVHDPWRPLGALRPASTLGRPPFSSRPVVLFLGFETDPDLADWVRATVNALVRRSTEGRIAIPEPTGGLHLTRPCAPTEQSVAALAPDVVVALDEQAVESGSRWLGGDRSAVIIQLTRDTTSAVEFVSWRIGRAQGRLRARIGRGIDAASLEHLVRRLSAGPQPLPPRDRRRSEVPAGRPRPTSPAKGALDPSTRIVALLGGRAATDRHRYAAFADHVEAFGGQFAIEDLDRRIPEPAHTADVLLLRGCASDPLVSDLARRRHRTGLVTVVDLGAPDVEPHATQPGGRLRLRGTALDLARLSTYMTTTSRSLQASLRTSGLRALVVPSLLTRGRASELAAHRSKRAPRGPAVIGWHTGSGSEGTAEAHETVAAMLHSMLEARPDLTVEVVGDGTKQAAKLAGHRRVNIAPGDPTIGHVARWTAQLWTTPSLEAELTGDLRAAVEAHYLGVPTLVAPDNPAVQEGLVVRALAVDTDDASRRIEELLDDEALWANRRDEAIGLAEALYGPPSSLAVMNRLLGLLRYAVAS